MTFISVSGSIGTGKSTLVKVIEKEWGYKSEEEKVSDALLNPYYKDIENNVKPSDIVLNVQLYFLIYRTLTHKHIQDSGENWVQERIFQEDRYVFAQSLHDSGFISEEGFKDYCDAYEKMTRGLKHPTLLVHLDSHPGLLRKRIEKRGRKSEQKLLELNNDYLKVMDTLYQKMLAEYDGPRLEINSAQYDIEESLEDKEEVLRMIKASLSKKYGN